MEFLLDSSESLQKWSDAFDRLSTQSYIPEFQSSCVFLLYQTDVFLLHDIFVVLIVYLNLI